MKEVAVVWVPISLLCHVYGLLFYSLHRIYPPGDRYVWAFDSEMQLLRFSPHHFLMKLFFTADKFQARVYICCLLYVGLSHSAVSSLAVLGGSERCRVR